MSVADIHPADTPAIGRPDAARRQAVVPIGVVRPSRIGAVDEGRPEGQARSEMAEAEPRWNPPRNPPSTEAAAVKSTAMEIRRRGIRRRGGPRLRWRSTQASNAAAAMAMIGRMTHSCIGCVLHPRRRPSASITPGPAAFRRGHTIARSAAWLTCGSRVATAAQRARTAPAVAPLIPTSVPTCRLATKPRKPPRS